MNTPASTVTPPFLSPQASLATPLVPQPKRASRAISPAPSVSLITSHTDPLADSGATDSLFRKADQHLLTNISPSGGRIVHLPNGTHIKSVGRGQLLTIPTVPAITGHIFPDTSLDRSLVSISDFTDHDCVVTLTKKDITIKHGNSVVLHNPKQPSDKLWSLSLPSANNKDQNVPVPPEPLQDSSAHSVISHQYNADRVAFAHATFGSPPNKTFLSALRNNFLGNFPVITAKMFSSNLPVSLATAKGHLDLNRQGQRSTKPHNKPAATTNLPCIPLQITTDDTDFLTTDDTDDFAPNEVTTFETVNWSESIHSDTTGRFPTQSRTGNNYILLSVYNGYTHVEPMASRHSHQYVKAVGKTLAFFRARKHSPAIQRMDNETSNELETYLLSQGIDIEYVSPHNHRANRAERYIRTFKNHFISILATTHSSFPLSLWDELLPQAEITLNLLRPCTANPSISAYEAIHRTKYDFAAHPIFPCGTLVLIHEPATTRGTWAPHGVKGYYLGPALQHYRNFRVYASDLRSCRISDTLAWFPEQFKLPGASAEEIATKASTDLTSVLRDITNNCTIDPEQREFLQRIAADTRDAILTAHALPQSPTSVRSPAPLVGPDPTPTVAPTHSAEEQRVPALPAPTTAPEQRVDCPAPDQRVRFADQATSRASNISEGHANNERPHRVPTKPRWLTESYVSNATAADEDLDFQIHPAEFEQLKWNTESKGANGAKWMNAMSEEFVRLFSKSKSMHAILPSDLPAGRTASYFNPQLRIKVKEEIDMYRVRGTYGGNKSDYEGETTALVAEMTSIKVLLNAVVSEPDAEFCTADITDFYLRTDDLETPEFMWISAHHLPIDIVETYNLRQFMTKKGSVLVKVTKGIYGLPQAGKLAQDQLIAHLDKHGYHQTPNSPCIFRHHSRPIAFSLVVDDFGIKFTGREHAEHLHNALREKYDITVDWTGSKYIGFTLTWDKALRTVTLSMPNYIANAIKRFGFQRSTKPVNSPIKFTQPVYGARVQQMTSLDTSAPLGAHQTKQLQQIVGVILYYARAIDSTMLMAVNRIASLQSHATTDVWDMAIHLLNYAAWWPNASIVYRASDMQLAVESDASYLSESNSRSRAGGFMYLTDSSSDKTDPQTRNINGALDCLSSIIPCVVASAAEAEYAALFVNAQNAESVRNTLADLSWPQGATPIVSDNSCAVGICNRTVKQKRTKAIDMRLHWTRDRVDQKHFTVTWRPGKTNLADYYTKPHPVKHYREVRSIYVTDLPPQQSRTSNRNK